MVFWPTPYVEDLPNERDDQSGGLERFALRFNGYRYWGSNDALFAVVARLEAMRTAGALRDATVAELLSAIFHAQRSSHHAGIPLERREISDLLSELEGRARAREETELGETTARLYAGMWDGLVRNERMLSSLLPRVAFEASVVAACCDGLLSVGGERIPTFDVALEARHEGLTKLDMVVSWEEDWGRVTRLLEVKLLWPNGAQECIKGIEADRRKLTGHEGFAVVFAYALEKGPYSERTTNEPLSECVSLAVASVGEPCWISPSRHFDIRDAAGDYQLIVWPIDPNDER